MGNNVGATLVVARKYGGNVGAGRVPARNTAQPNSK